MKSRHVPTIEVHGPYAEHDQCCAIMFYEPAVLDMHEWVFRPSWKAQKDGWRLVRARNWLQRAVLRAFFGVEKPR